MTILHSGQNREKWRTWRFDQMAVNVNDRIDNPSEADVEHYVGLEHLDTDSLKIRRWGSPSDVEATKLRFRKGDILFGRRRVYQRKVAVAEFDGICSAHAMVLRANPEVVVPDFLPFFMQSSLFMDLALEISVGSLSPTINWKTLANQQFSLPPIDEQKRVAALLKRIRGAIEAVADLEFSIEQLRRSYIVAAFSKLLQAHRVTKVSVAQAGEVLMGRQRAPQYDLGLSPRPYLRVANVYDGYIDTSDVKQMDFSEEEFHRYKLLPGDVLLNEGQSRELVGRSSIFRGEIADCCYQNTLIRFRSRTVSPEYAHHYFQFCLYTGRFISVSKQTTSIAHLGVNRFAELSFPIPQPEVEIDITSNLARIEARLRATSERITQLKKLERTTLQGELLS